MLKTRDHSLSFKILSRVSTAFSIIIFLIVFLLSIMEYFFG